ncbi:MAG: hypothetical protein Q8L49_15660 [Burkholderiaceae bacterium]|nr:hypothetical protein [Burkholderiaceae bacterium]
MQQLAHLTRPLMVAFCLALTGCGDGLSKSSLAKVIDEHQKTRFKPTCWSVQRVPAQLPLTIGLTQPPEAHPILGGLGRAGYITAHIGRQGLFGADWTIALTEAGRSAGVWDQNKGFCVGQRRVHEVLRWTEPAQGRGATTTQVTYTWKLADRPKWVKPELFAEVEGMTEPVESSITLVKTSDGWRSER